MARPSKATDVIKEEGKSHRTKAELSQRAAAEKATLTGLPIRESAEVKNDLIAHNEFLRVRKILTAAGKNDALYESVINDYCIYKSDIARYAVMRSNIRDDINDLIDTDMDAEVKYKVKTSLYKQIVDCDKQIQAYQKKRFDIEKENGMTIASSMRSIPKKAEKNTNPLLEALNDDS